MTKTKTKTKKQIGHEIDAFLDEVDHLDRRWRGTKVQSLLFERPQWNARTAKIWAKGHSYHYGKVDMTERHVRLRQSAPVSGAEKRTVTFGNGIKAVVEEQVK